MRRIFLWSLALSAVSAVTGCGGAGTTAMPLLEHASQSVDSHVNLTTPPPINKVFGSRSIVYSAGSIADSVGVNLYLIPAPTMMPSDATALGSIVASAHIRHYRVGVRQKDAVYASNILAFNAASGARPIIVTDCAPAVGRYVVTTPQDLMAFQSSIKNSGDAVEGVNEPDERIANDSNWSADLNACQASLNEVLPLPYAAPALAFSNSYAATGKIPDMSVANIHRYLGSYNPGTAGYGNVHACGKYGSLAFWQCLSTGEAGSSTSTYITETGWNSEDGDVDRATQAKYSARTILYDYVHNVSRTYFYTLIGYLDGDGFGGCGLLNPDHSPKPAFRAISTLLNALADDSRPTDFAPKPADISVSGVSASVMMVPMQKANGSYVVAIWNEALGFDPASKTPLAVAKQNATISIPTGQIVKSVVTIGDTGLASNGPYTANIMNIIVPVDDHVTLVTLATP